MNFSTYTVKKYSMKGWMLDAFLACVSGRFSRRDRVYYYMGSVKYSCGQLQENDTKRLLQTQIDQNFTIRTRLALFFCVPMC